MLVVLNHKVGPIKTIMIIDDKSRILEEVKAFLQDDEFEVITTKSSREALEILEERNVDLILVDTPLPQTLREGLFSVKPRSTMLTAETDTFLEKPFTQEELRTFIRKEVKTISSP